MPVPKRKTSKSRRDRRHSSRFIRPKAFALCSNCGVALAPHSACADCGFYKGAKVIVTKAERGSVRAERKKREAAKEAKNQESVSE